MEADTVRRRAGYALGALGLAALVVVGGVLGRADSPADPAPDVTLPTATIAPSTSPRPTQPPVAVSEVGPLMPGATGWELFAQGPGVLARLELASGRITRTVIPEIDSGGPMTLLAGPDRVLIRPGDAVSGYVVPDGRPAEAITVPTLQSGLPVPGPAPGLVWVPRDDVASPTYILIDLDGRPTGPTIKLPTMFGWQASSDGAGNLLFSDVGGAYQATPAGVRRITTGAVLATGPTGWLVIDCDDRFRCTRTVVDRATWGRRPLGPAPGLFASAGAIAPDGSRAAIIGNDQVGNTSVQLIDLATGAVRALPLPVGDITGLPGTLLWGPDSRSLFMVSGGKPVVVDARTGGSRVLAPDLPPMTLLAFRSP